MTANRPPSLSGTFEQGRGGDASGGYSIVMSTTSAMYDEKQPKQAMPR